MDGGSLAIFITRRSCLRLRRPSPLSRRSPKESGSTSSKLRFAGRRLHARTAFGDGSRRKLRGGRGGRLSLGMSSDLPPTVERTCYHAGYRRPPHGTVT